MKTNFAKKIFKILIGTIFSVFVLTLFNFATVYAKAAYSVEENTYSDGGYEVTKTTTVYEDENGKEITKVEEVPTDTRYGHGTLKESYTDSAGVEHTRNGYINKSGDYSWDSNDWYTTDEFSGSAIEDNKSSNTGSGKYSYTLLQSLPGANETLSKDVTIEQYLTWAFRFTLALAGFLAVMMIVIGGVEYIISGANEKMRGEAHSRITNAIYGLVLALVSYLVLYTINPSLVDFENNQFFKKKTTTSSSDNNNNNTETNNNDNSSSNVGDNLRGEGITEIEDVPFDFGDQQ